MSDSLASPASHTSEIRHSRFLAQASAAASVDAALAFLAAVSDRDAQLLGVSHRWRIPLQ